MIERWKTVNSYLQLQWTRYDSISTSQYIQIKHAYLKKITWSLFFFWGGGWVIEVYVPILNHLNLPLRLFKTDNTPQLQIKIANTPSAFSVCASNVKWRIPALLMNKI